MISRYIVRVWFPRHMPPVVYQLPTRESAERFARTFRGVWDEIDVVRRSDAKRVFRRRPKRQRRIQMA